MKYLLLRLIGATRESLRPLLGRWFASKPKIINLNIIDVCNSHCRMCNIWKQDSKIDITPTELEKILSDELFDQVTHVGVTGGEPTLRDDIAEVFAKLIVALPKVEHLSIITNAINYDDICAKLKDIDRVCTNGGKRFSIMISIDGVGKVHDLIRGTKGNFESAEKLIGFARKELSKGVTIGATISKRNAWNVDELYHFLVDHNLYGRFRVAEFITRLYNEDRKVDIRNFTAEERFHLMLFFYKVYLKFETNTTYKRTYLNIINMLNGEPRKTGCNYQHNGVTLGSTGKLGFCAPKSPFIGDALNEDAMLVYKKNISTRSEILKSHCKDCIHDYHSPENLRQFMDEFRPKLFQKLVTGKLPKVLTRGALKLAKAKKEEGTTSILIIGWYGTETIGDLAILGGICQYYHSQNRKYRISVASLYSWFTEYNVKQLGLKVDVLPYFSMEYIRALKTCDILTMGGGPLMDLHELKIINFAFKQVNKTTNRHILGCGLGPLNEEKNIHLVRGILENADLIYLRDQASSTRASDLIKESQNLSEDNINEKTSKIKVSGDYAELYIKDIQINGTKEVSSTIRFYLRELPQQYYPHLSAKAFAEHKIQFEANLAVFVRELLTDYPEFDIQFEHMSNFIVAHDDRDFSIRFINSYFKDESRVSYTSRPSTVQSIVESMQSSSFNVCMRFHSVLFAHCLETKFIALDYTNGGKIKGFLDDKKEAHRRIPVDEIVTNGLTVEKVQSVLSAK